MSWERAFADVGQTLARRPAARQPGTLGEIWRAEWDAAGLDAFTGSGEPMTEAFEELRSRTATITGKDVPELARERGLAFEGRGFDGRIDTIGKIIDTLPDAQAKLLTDYRDVRKRAREKAAATMKEAEDLRASSYGLSAVATGFAAQVARQMVDPVNLATVPFGAAAPLRGAGAAATAKWLGKEFAIGAGAQAVQEPVIRFNRQELGLETNSLENVLTAGLGQAGLSGLFRAAAVGLDRARFGAAGSDKRFAYELNALADSLQIREGAASEGLRPFGELPMTGRDLPMGGRFDPAADEALRLAGRLDAAAPAFEARSRLPQLSEEDLAALAAKSEADGIFDRLTGDGPQAAERFRDATRFLSEGGPLPADGPGISLTGVQRLTRPDGSTLGVRYAVVERADLQASHDAMGGLNPLYPQALQPRDRSRGVSADQINAIAARLEPEQLTWSPVADYGAPVVGPDGFVESGNGRVLAIEQAYRRHPERAEAYRSKIEALGFDTEGMQEPILIRLRTEDIDPADRVKLSIEGNKPAVAAMSDSERAFVDARFMDDIAMQLWRGGEVGSAANAPFVRSFIDRALTPAERGEMTDGAGRLSQKGETRVTAALVAKAWGDRDMVAALFDIRDSEGLNWLRGMADASPQLASLRAAVAEGRLPPGLDVATPLREALAMAKRARAEGRPVAELLDQMDLMSGAVRADVEAALKLLYADEAMTVAAGRARVAERLDHAISSALMSQAGGLFGDAADAGGFLRAARFAGENLSSVELAKAMTAAAEKPAKIDVTSKAFTELADAADLSLSPDAQTAVTDFVAHGPKSRDKTGMAAFGIMRAHRLEEAVRTDNAIARELQEKIAPLKAELRAAYGNTITLHRFQRKIVNDPNVISGSAPSDGKRAVLSWSPDRNFVEAFGGVEKPHKVISDSEIDRLQAEYDRTGVVVLPNRMTMKREPLTTLLPNADPNKVTHSLYRGNEYITDAMSVRDALSGDIEWAIERNAKRKEDLQRIITANVSIDDIVWITDRAGQREFIVRNYEGAAQYIDPLGHHSPPKQEPAPKAKAEPAAKADAKPDPVTARLDALAAEMPADAVLALPRGDGTQAAKPLREHMADLAAERAAAGELKDCIARAGGDMGGVA